MDSRAAPVIGGSPIGYAVKTRRVAEVRQG